MEATEGKFCPTEKGGCGKKLRSNNERGACSDCLARGKVKLADVAIDKPKARVKPPPKNGDAGEALAKFRIVAEAIGHDPDELLGGMAQEWLDQLRASMAED